MRHTFAAVRGSSSGRASTLQVEGYRFDSLSPDHFQDLQAYLHAGIFAAGMGQVL